MAKDGEIMDFPCFSSSLMLLYYFFILFSSRKGLILLDLDMMIFKTLFFLPLQASCSQDYNKVVRITIKQHVSVNKLLLWDSGLQFAFYFSLRSKYS